MKKSNQKGFMLVEAFIVSTLVLAVLVFMFVQIRTVINGFDKSFSYNTVSGIYIANELSDYIQARGYDEETVENEGYIIKGYNSYESHGIDVSDIWNRMLKNTNIKNVIISTSDTTKLKSSLSAEISAGLKDYVKTLKIDGFNEHRLIIEFNDKTYASIKMI